jgi:hypothetical protein
MKSTAITEPLQQSGYYDKFYRAPTVTRVRPDGEACPVAQRN